MKLETSGNIEERARILGNALREVFTEPDGSLSYRDVLNLSSDCSSFVHGKGCFLAEIRKCMEQRFSEQILCISEKINGFEDARIDVEEMDPVRSSVSDWIMMVYGAAEHPPVPVSPNCVGTIGHKCLEVIRALKGVVEALQSHAQIVDSMVKVLLPLNTTCYFMDRKMNFVEKIYRKMLLRGLRKCKSGMKGFLGLSLLISNSLFSSKNNVGSADMFSDDIKYFLGVLGGFGMKNKVLIGSKDLMVEQDFHILASQKNDFEAVFKYFNDQRYIYPLKFHRRIEKLVLKQIYSDFDESVIISKFKRLEKLEFILRIFVKSGIKDKLLRIYGKFIGSVGSDFGGFFPIYKTNQEILEIFDDEEFRSASRVFFENFFESVSTCEQVADFIDRSFGTASDEVYDMVVHITEESKNPEHFIKELQQRLALRLLSGSSDLEREMNFLKRFKRMYSENMICMINDVQARRPSLLLMTMCKWPIFKTESIPLTSDHPVALFKSEIEAGLKEKRKRVSWIDSLSKVRFELFGRVLETSLFQYGIISEILRQGKPVSKDQSCLYFQNVIKDDVVCTVKIERSAVKIPKAYSGQFSSLLGNILLQAGDFLILNPYSTEPISFEYEFQSCLDESENDHSYNVKAFYEAKISRILKRSKEMALEDLHTSIGEIEFGEMKEYLVGLQEKGFVEFFGDKVVYCP